MFKKLLNRKKRKLLKAQRNEPLPHNREAFFSINNIKVISTYTELKNCQVIANTRFVISENEKLFFTSGSLPNYTFQEALQKWVLCEEDFSNCKYYEDDGKISFKINKAEKFLFGNSLYASNYEPNNIYHFFMDCMFDAILAHEKGIKIDNIIISATLIERFREILKTLFPQAKIIEAQNGEIVTTQNLILFGQRNVQWHWLRENADENEKPSEGRQYFNEEYLLKLREFLLVNFDIKSHISRKNSSSKKIVFIPRKSSFRNTLNQSALEQFLKEKCRGNELLIIDPLKISFQEMGEILSDTDLLFCQEGAALFNMIFAGKKEMQIVTWPLFDKKKQDSIYEDISKILGYNFLALPALWLKSEKTTGESAAQLASESLSDLLAPIHLIDNFLTEFLSSDKNRKI